MPEDNGIRPNISIPEKLHAKVKRLAELKEIETSEAYIQVLNQGIDYSVFPEDDSPDSGSFDCTFISLRSNRVIGYESPVTFHPKLGFGDEITAAQISHPHQPLSFDEFEEALTTVSKHPKSDSQNATFTIARSGGMWVGQGLSNFFPTLGNLTERYDMHDFESLQTEEFVLIIPVESQYLFIKARPNHDHNQISINSMRSYRPLSSSGSKAIKSVLGPFKAELLNYEQSNSIITASLSERVQPIDYLIKETEKVDYVEKILIETPVGLFNQIETPLSHTTTAPQYLLADLTQHIKAEDRSDAVYGASKISILETNNFSNLWIEADWQIN